MTSPHDIPPLAVQARARRRTRGQEQLSCLLRAPGRVSERSLEGSLATDSATVAPRTCSPSMRGPARFLRNRGGRIAVQINLRDVLAKSRDAAVLLVTAR